MAETVVELNSVSCEISTRDTGPHRRIASMTWKRLIARINSGSAVFIARALPIGPRVFYGKRNYFQVCDGMSTARFWLSGYFLPVA